MEEKKDDKNYSILKIQMFNKLFQFWVDVNLILEQSLIVNIYSMLGVVKYSKGRARWNKIWEGKKAKS